MSEKIKSINLLPQKGDGLVDQFLAWALTIGRLLIILTETLALGTFLYRFSIDMRIVDLNDLIKNQKIIVQQFATTEENARNLQARLALAKTHDTQSTTTPNIFSDIINMGRNQITFKNLAISDGVVKIDAQAGNSNALSLFVSKLRAHPEISSITINSVENKTSSALVRMTLTGQLKGSGKEATQVPDSAPGMRGAPVMPNVNL